MSLKASSNRTSLLLIPILLLGTLFPACREELPTSDDSPDWTQVQQKAEIIKKEKKEIRIESIIFLNDFCRNFDSLTTYPGLSTEKYAYNLKKLVVIQGEHKSRKKRRKEKNRNRKTRLTKEAAIIAIVH